MVASSRPRLQVIQTSALRRHLAGRGLPRFRTPAPLREAASAPQPAPAASHVRAGRSRLLATKAASLGTPPHPRAPRAEVVPPPRPPPARLGRRRRDFHRRPSRQRHKTYGGSVARAEDGRWPPEVAKGSLGAVGRERGPPPTRCAAPRAPALGCCPCRVRRSRSRRRRPKPASRPCLPEHLARSRKARRLRRVEPLRPCRLPERRPAAR